MSFNIKLYINKSSNNTLNKDLTNENELEMLLKDDTIIEKPVILIRKTDTIDIALHDFNYCYIPKFDRYYYITKRESVNATMWKLYCNVDVLMSFSNEIKKLKAIVERSKKYYNTYITDDSYTVQNRTRVQTKTFPKGFENDSLVLIVAG